MLVLLVLLLVFFILPFFLLYTCRYSYGALANKMSAWDPFISKVAEIYYYRISKSSPPRIVGRFLFKFLQTLLVRLVLLSTDLTATGNHRFFEKSLLVSFVDSSVPFLLLPGVRTSRFLHKQFCSHDGKSLPIVVSRFTGGKTDGQ